MLNIYSGTQKLGYDAQKVFSVCMSEITYRYEEWWGAGQ